MADAPPDLVILDLNLPVVSGFKVYRILRMRPATERIPIIILTARASEADRVVGLDSARTTTSGPNPSIRQSVDS